MATRRLRARPAEHGRPVRVPKFHGAACARRLAVARGGARCLKGPDKPRRSKPFLRSENISRGFRPRGRSTARTVRGGLRGKPRAGKGDPAVTRGMAEWMPNSRASQLAAETTPRRLGWPPTTTGLPRSSGRSSSSTETKKASISTCRMGVASPASGAASCLARNEANCGIGYGRVGRRTDLHENRCRAVCQAARAALRSDGRTRPA